MIGQSSLTCQTDGTWNGFPPFCLAPCPDPGVPKNGVRWGINFNHGQTFIFVCKKNDTISGPSMITCLNGTWNDDAPKCYKECGSPLGMENRKIPNKNIRASSSWNGWYDAKYGRLNGGSAWCSSIGDTRPYLGIDLGKPYNITYLQSLTKVLARM